jgi:hypothetical protein
MDDSKAVFEKDFDNLFNEIWLVRLLCDLWCVFPWNDDNLVVPGMMFKFSMCEMNGRQFIKSAKDDESLARDILQAENRLYISKWVDELFVVTKVTYHNDSSSYRMYFRLNWVDAGDMRVWNDASIIRMGERYYIAFNHNGTLSRIKSIGCNV